MGGAGVGLFLPEADGDGADFGEAVCGPAAAVAVVAVPGGAAVVIQTAFAARAQTTVTSAEPRMKRKRGTAMILPPLSELWWDRAERKGVLASLTNVPHEGARAQDQPRTRSVVGFRTARADVASGPGNGGS